MARESAWVFGGASGMGYATVERLHARGMDVVIIDIAPTTEAVAKKLNLQGVTCDITSETLLTDCLEKLAQKHKPRAIINCVGIAPAARIVGKTGPCSLEAFNHVIQVNLCGAFNILRLGAYHMSQRDADNEGQRGVIIQTASIAAFDGQIGQAAYSASKGGMAAMTLPAARELAKFGIRVMTIAPGLIDTPLLRGLPEEVQASLKAGTPFPKRFGYVSEFSALVEHILDNPFLNGEVIRLDGALRMN
jgi:NAD(P)-dependent dehydrogenase (short-subunit alcohol dehydrogenase family)